MRGHHCNKQPMDYWTYTKYDRDVCAWCGARTIEEEQAETIETLQSQLEEAKAELVKNETDRDAWHHHRIHQIKLFDAETAIFKAEIHLLRERVKKLSEAGNNLADNYGWKRNKHVFRNNNGQDEECAGRCVACKFTEALAADELLQKNGEGG